MPHSFHSIVRRWDLARSASVVSLALVAACSGGGGSGSGGSSGFALTDVKYGRVVDDGTGPRLVSPLTTATIDPTTGFMVPGSLEPLAPGVDVTKPQSLGIGSGYLPRVIPRNGILQLEFSETILASSVTADVADAAGNVITSGSVQIRTQDNKAIPVEISVHGGNKIWIRPAVGTVGFPPSPIDFGPSGEPRADATGFLKLRLPRNGSAVLRSAGGSFLGQRPDKLGDSNTPIGINPGNTVLDFITHEHLIPSSETFNGFLPDKRPPRIVRTYDFGGPLDFGAGDGATATTLTDAQAAFSTTAKQGQGEWAGAIVTVRPGTPTEEVRNVLSNTRTTVTLAAPFTTIPQDGDVYRLERSELFEPDLNDPIEPALFDPDNPENLNNTQLAEFVEVYEIDSLGNAVRGPLSLRDSVPTFSELRIRFTEPIAAESLLPWETFEATYVPDNQDVLAETIVDAATQQIAILRPVRRDQQAGTIEVVGWGKGIKNMQLVLTTVPKASYLQQYLTTTDVAAFLDEGVRSVTDLGGQPLAFPDSMFDPASPAIRIAVPFTSTESAITQVPPPVIQSWGVMVHRLQGRPITGIDPATGEPGVGFRDQVNYYSPIGDVNLLTNGYLAGSPVVYSTKIHDDFFPPPHGQFGKFPLGLAEPLSTPPLTGAPTPHDGARFQVVWRDIDASPSRDALAGTLLDLYRVSWAPIGGNVSSDSYDNISIHCAHSPLRPLTTQNGASANDPFSGLSQPFDFSTWLTVADPNVADLCPASCNAGSGPNYWDTLITCVQPGTSYKIAQNNLFSPPHDGNAYHPWPTFDVPFQYNNGDIPKEEKDLRAANNHGCWFEKRQYSSDPDYDNLGGDSLLFEVRIRPQAANVSQRNGFTMAVGVLLSIYPKFRIYTLGTSTKKLNPDDMNNQHSRCAVWHTDAPKNDVPNGDNSRYFTVLDYVKTTSRIRSPWVRVFPSNTSAPDYFPAILTPPLTDQPAGTTVTLQFEGATTIRGSNGTGFSTDIDDADTQPNVAFKATLVGNTESLLLPTFDTIAIPYLRPTGS